MKYTEFMILVDTHVTSDGPGHEEELGQDLLRITKKFATPAVLKQLLLVEDPKKLRSAKVINASVEVGDKYKRIHIHFNLTVQHETKVYLKHPDGRTINTQLGKWFSDELEPITGKRAFVSVGLVSSAAKNYAVKSSSATGDFGVAMGSQSGRRSDEPQAGVGGSRGANRAPVAAQDEKN